jgi:hypothetical protein
MGMPGPEAGAAALPDAGYQVQYAAYAPAEARLVFDGQRIKAGSGPDAVLAPSPSGSWRQRASAWAQRAGAWLRPAPEPVDPIEAQKASVYSAHYREFAARDYWGRVRPGLARELAAVRALGGKAAVRAYIRDEADKVLARIRAAHGTGNVGFHYNLHGGTPESYVRGGIRASVGDIALRYGFPGDPHDKVYFFQSSEHDLFSILDASNGERPWARMGTVLMLFRRDSPVLAQALESRAASHPTAISLHFDTHRMRGIAYEDFLVPPLEAFKGVAKKSGQARLSRDEETLAVLRYIEAAVLDPAARLPRT